MFNCGLCKQATKIKLDDNECLLDSNTQVENDLAHYSADMNHYLLKKLGYSIKNVEGWLRN